MKPSIRSKSLAPLLITLFALTAVSAAHASDTRNCSTTSVAGKFGFTTTGSIPAIGTVAATGIFTQHASGNITGTQTRSLNGDIADRDLYGNCHSESRLHGHDTIQVFKVEFWSARPLCTWSMTTMDAKPARSSLLSCCPTGPALQASLLLRPEEYSLGNQTSH